MANNDNFYLQLMEQFRTLAHRLCEEAERLAIQGQVAKDRPDGQYTVDWTADVKYTLDVKTYEDPSILLSGTSTAFL